jgi:hypothetical protein
MRFRLAVTLFAAFASAANAFAQTAPAPQPGTDPATTSTTPAATTPPPATAPTPSTLSSPASAAYDRKDNLPNLNVYLPEGQASIRLRKLIRNVLFESQIDYKFSNGDISTFLRYKYYARNFTYRLGVFDQINFHEDVVRGTSGSFERVRGGLLLFEFPHDYNNRYYYLLEDDRLTFGDVTDVDNRKNNIYAKLAYQYGTQFDERLNAIVGESRGRITPVLTAFRELGPQHFSFAAALTQSAHLGTGAYRYTKLESEGLGRFDLTNTSFLVSRLHVGVFPVRGHAVPPPPTTPDDVVPQYQSYSVPRYELFALGGREALRSVSDDIDSEGTHEVHETNEYFVPVFRNKNYNMWGAHWNTLYAIAYAGVGSVGFDYRDLGKSDHTVADVGVGGEASLTFRDYDVLLSVLYARGVHAPDGLKGSKVRFFIRTSR